MTNAMVGYEKTSMNILQLIGVLIIANILIWGIWYVSQGQKLNFGGGSLLTAGLVTGLAFVFYSREVTVSFSKEGASIKAAAERVQEDAASVAAIRARVEAQAATMDLVAQDSATAKKLLEGLRQENAKAEEKLKLIEERTAQIKTLPDGRIRMGGSVSGSPIILEKHFNEMLRAVKENRLDDAYSEAKECILIYESTIDQMRGAALIAGGDLTPESLEQLYATAAGLALKRGENDQGLDYHSKSLKAKPTADRTAYHALLLIQAKRTMEATKLIEEALRREEPFSSEFKSKLVELKILPPVHQE